MGVILLDVVLGHAAHPDPAAEIAPVVGSALARSTGAHRRRVAHRLAPRPAGPQPAGEHVAPSRGARLHVQRARRSFRHLGRNRGAGRVTDLLRRDPHVITAGIELLAQAVEHQAVRVSRVDWRPPMAGTEADLAAVMADPRRRTGNAEAMRRMFAVRPPAGRRAAGRRGARTSRPAEFLHAGPPIDWDAASGPLRGASSGAAALRGLGRPAGRGRSAVRGRAGSPGSVPPPLGGRTDGRRGRRRRCGCSCVAGPGDRRPAVLLAQRGPGQGPALRRLLAEVLDRLRWMADVLGPLLQTAVRRPGPIDLTAILAQMLQMGDEAHNRNRAGTLLLLRELLPAMIDSGRPPTTSPRPCGSSPATTTSSSTWPCRRASWRSTPRATSPARPWSWRWPATARTSASRSWHRRRVVHRRRPCVPDGLYLGATVRPTPTPTSATRRSPRPRASAGSPWPRPPPSCGSSAERWPTRWRRRDACTRSPLGEHPTVPSRCWTSAAARAAST